MMERLRRILAMLLVIFLVLMVFVMLYLGITGSRYFLISVYVTLGFPLLLYAFMFIYKLLKNR